VDAEILSLKACLHGGTEPRRVTERSPQAFSEAPKGIAPDMNVGVVKGEFMARPENDRDIRKYARIPSGGRAELSWMVDGKPEKTRARVSTYPGMG